MTRTYRFDLHTSTPNVPIGYEFFNMVLGIFLSNENVENILFVVTNDLLLKFKFL